MVLKKILLLFNKKQKISFIVTIILGILFSILELFSIAVFLPLINIIESGKIELIENNNLLSIIFFDYLLIKDFEEVVIFISIFIIFIYLFKLIYHRFFNHFRLKFVNDFTEKLINDFFYKFQSQNYINYKYSSSSDQLQKIFNESKQIRSIIDSLIIIFSESFTIILLISTSLLYDYKTSFLSLFFFLLVYFIWNFLSKTDLNTLGSIRKKHDIYTFKIFQICYSAFREILIYKQGKFFNDIFQKHNKIALDSLYKYSYKKDNVKPIIEFITFFIISILIIYLIKYSDSQSLIMKLSFFALLAYKLMPSINRFSGLFYLINYNKVALNFDLDAFKSINKDSLITETKSVNINKIDFIDVSFKFPSRDDYIFKNLNVSFKKGDVLGIKGESGSGKSTFIDLFLGLLNPSSGEILINNKNLKNIKDSFWSNISSVSQEINLIEGTLRENLIFGDKSITDDEIYKILGEVNLSEMLSSFTNGLDEIIFENSSNISGGQKQRIAIAKALLRNPQILILDEATSSLDKKNEIQFINLISKIKKSNPELIIIIVSHTIPIFKLANYLYEIKNQTFVQIKK